MHTKVFNMAKNILFVIEKDIEVERFNISQAKKIIANNSINKTYLIEIISSLDNHLMYSRILNMIGNRLQIPTENQILEVGEPEKAIKQFIKDYKITLLILTRFKKNALYSTAFSLILYPNCEIISIDER
jgi:hypothetical protein